MRDTLRSRGRRWLAVVVCLSLSTLALGAPPRTYQGKLLAVWLEAMSYDLDPDYRRAARDAVIHFGSAALNPLSDILDRNEMPEAVALATGALIRLGPAGRAIVSRKLARAADSGDRRLQAGLFHVIRGIGDAGALARPFVPHLRTLANMPDVSMIALRVLAQTEAASEPIPTDNAETRIEATGAGAFVSLIPYDCFVEGRFGAIRFEVTTSRGADVREARIIFKSPLAETAYYVEAKVIDKERRIFEGALPKPTLGVTALSYQVSVETNLGSVTTEAVVGGVAPTEEGCALIGGRAVPEAHPSVVGVFEYKGR